ncbi:hypothetical protein MAR_019019, partial [Mya arenaria]
MEEFIFVHQNSDQKRLLAKYGHKICLLDATYKTTKYDLPLLFFCVNTNVGYMFRQSSYNIRRGLQVLKAWNPSWTPTFFMTDYDRKGINAIENTFPEMGTIPPTEDYCQDAVQLLWDHPCDFDIPVAKVYGTTVTDTDIRSLQSPEWLADNIIDAYLHMLCLEVTEGKVGRMLHVDSISMNAIMNKTFRPRDPPNIYEYMFVVGAYCREAHWMLVVSLIRKDRVFLLSSTTSFLEGLNINIYQIFIQLLLWTTVHLQILDVEEKKVFFYNPIQAVEVLECGTIKKA